MKIKVWMMEVIKIRSKIVMTVGELSQRRTLKMACIIVVNVKMIIVKNVIGKEKTTASKYPRQRSFGLG